MKIEEMLDDVVELKVLATTKVLRALIAELDVYRGSLGREPSAYALFHRQVMGRGGVNNALSRFNDKRRADNKPIIGLKNVRHHGVPIIVRADA